jgi:NAD(P)H-hydrate epimerase
MSGAAYLCALAAYRTGAGLVEILTVESNRVILATLLPEAIVSTYKNGELSRDKVDISLARADALVIGCGLGKSETARELLRYVLQKKRSGLPTVADADALNIISEDKEMIKLAKGAVITPHLLEMSRLSGSELTEISENVARSAHAFSAENNVICVLKCHNTAVADGTGEVYINKLGNSGMATGGSGDVLAGIIGGILAQNKKSSLSVFEAARLGVFLHSKAGDIAAEKIGEYSLMARDIIDALPTAINSHVTCS